MDFANEHHKTTEHAHNHKDKREARRKLITKVGKIAAVGVLATAAAVEALSFIQKEGKGEAVPPNAFYNGKIEIVMSDGLNVRTSPNINNLNDGEFDNTVNWDQVEQIKSKGDTWINVKGNEAFVISMPGIYKVDEPHPIDPWLTFDAKVKDGFGTVEERLYVNFSPKTDQFVKRIDKGSIYELGGNSGTDWTGTISLPSTG